MEQIEIINLEDVSDEEAKEYKIRETTRAVILDENNMLALIYSAKNNYYTFPGGGVEENEDFDTAVKRECKEEAGCHIEIIKEIGSVMEYRRKHELKQISYYYLAKISGEKGAPSLTDGEIEEGYETMWVSYEDVAEKFKKDDRDFYEGPAMKSRDLVILEKIKEHFKK